MLGMETITPTRLAEIVGISLPYSSQILKGRRVPSRALAIHIMRITGWKHPVIADLTTEQIDMLESIDPYRPTDRAA